MKKSDSEEYSSDSDEGPILPVLPTLDIKKIKTTFKHLNLFKNLFPKNKKDPIDFGTRDVVFVVFFMFVGMFTRVFRIQFPRQVVFDEVYFGRFTNNYINGQYFGDIHPPLAKLLMAGIAYFSEYKADLNFSQISADSSNYPSMVYVSLRMIPAFFSALVVPLTYITMRICKYSVSLSFTSATIMALELLHIIEGRHILSDGILHFFSSLAIFSIFFYERFENLPALIFEGFCLAFVASCKYTSGGIVLMALIRQFNFSNLINFRLNKEVPAIIRSIILVSIVAVFHIFIYSVHLTVLPYKGEGAPKCVEAALVNKDHPDWNARRKGPSMLRRVLVLILTMHQSNMRVAHGHPYASKWYQWPLATGRWLLLWTKDGRHLIAMGNVLVWVPLFVGIVISCVYVLYNRQYSSPLGGFVLGYVLSLLPFALVPREVYIYHYCIPLLFAAHCGPALLSVLPGRFRGFLNAGLMTAAICGFLLWCPWAYGLTTPDFNFLVWNNRWCF